MNPNTLAPYQIELIEQPAQFKTFLEGPAGSGKTTVGVRRMVHLLRSGIPASNVLVLSPQRTLAEPYQNALRDMKNRAGGSITMLTIGGLARRMVELFWPLVSEKAGFDHPDQPPAFLTLESAQYYMAHLVRPLLDQGLFDSVTIDRNRIYSQIIDNLNKAAIVGFDYKTIGARLESAWLEDSAKAHIYRDAQQCANIFREFCLRNNLLDFSLQVEIFRDRLWEDKDEPWLTTPCRAYLLETYRHLIYDNLEEDPPVAHKVVGEWLPDLDSALLIYDQDAGYRQFLGADPESGHTLVEGCSEYHVFTHPWITPAPLDSFCGQVGLALDRKTPVSAPPLRSDELHLAFDYPEKTLRFFPQMLDWVVDRTDDLIQKGTPAGEIVLLAPLLPDSLRFSLANRLEARGIAHRSHRPSRSLREEPAAQALLTIAELAHPQWGFHPGSFEVAYALLQAIDGLDLVRAQLLVEIVYRATAGPLALAPFENIRPEAQERITYSVGNRYETLRRWLEAYAQEPAVELDYFFSRLFGEVLSQPGFGFHANHAAGPVCENLIESTQKFRWAVEGRLTGGHEDGPAALGQEYLRMLRDGVLAAQYIQAWQIPPDDAVLIAPAYTFLLANQPVDHQFWLDVGSTGWAERLYQPLTHPIILSRGWRQDRVWTDVDEYEHNREGLYRLVVGLARRCRKQIHLGLCELGEGGYESRGMLLRSLQLVLAQSRGYTR